MKKFTIWLSAFSAIICSTGTTLAQNGSLFHRTSTANAVQTASYRPQEAMQNQTGVDRNVPQQSFSPQSMVPQNDGAVLPMSYAPDPTYGIQAGLTYIPPSQVRTIGLHDIVTVRVDEAGTALMLGNATSRKTTSLDAVLSNWVKLTAIDTLKPATQSDGDPRVTGLSNEVYRGDSLIRTNESLTFNIATQVVDIKPNGLITLQGTKKITFNDNIMQVFLIGSCRSQDIDPNNTLLSRNLLDIEIKRADDGHVRDGYSRGWLTKLYAKFKPF
jgi:flagellar L-ring protein precursor FlgH